MAVFTKIIKSEAPAKINKDACTLTQKCTRTHTHYNTQEEQGNNQPQCVHKCYNFDFIIYLANRLKTLVPFKCALSKRKPFLYKYTYNSAPVFKLQSNSGTRPAVLSYIATSMQYIIKNTM